MVLQPGLLHGRGTGVARSIPIRPDPHVDDAGRALALALTAPAGTYDALSEVIDEGGGPLLNRRKEVDVVG